MDFVRIQVITVLSRVRNCGSRLAHEIQPMKHIYGCANPGEGPGSCQSAMYESLILIAAIKRRKRAKKKKKCCLKKKCVLLQTRMPELSMQALTYAWTGTGINQCGLMPEIFSPHTLKDFSLKPLLTRRMHCRGMLVIACHPWHDRLYIYRIHSWRINHYTQAPAAA